MEVTLVKQPYEISFSGNPLPYSFSIFPYGSNERSQDIRLIVRVYIEQAFNTGSFTEIKSQVFKPDDSGMVNLDVQTLINPYLEYYTPKPSLKRPVQCLQQRKRYKLQYLLQKDNVLVGSIEDTDILYAVKGGMSYDEWHPSEFFTRQILTDKKPLHYILPKESCFADELKWLYWLYPLADNKMQTVYAEIELNDNTSILHILPKTIYGGKWSVFCCPAGFNQLGLEALVPDGLFAISYTLWVNNADNISVVAPVKFTLDQRKFYNTYQLLYRNSLGGIDTITLRGQVDFEADYTRQQAQRTVPPVSYINLLLQPHVVDSATTESQKFKGDTGFISMAVADRLRDLFLSREKYEYNGKSYPLAMNPKNVKFFTNKDQLISLQLEWQRAYVNNWYTPAGIMPQSRVCPAIESLSAKQINKSLLQIMYAAPIPYDQVQVEIITSAGTETFTYFGNTKTVRQQFTNPILTGTEDITVRCRVVCDADTDPQDVGPWTSVILTITANTLPVAVDDYYNIPVGYNSPIVLSGSVLANDYDPDGDPIEVIAASGATNDGGTFDINAAGIVTYQPDTSAYTGQDYFDYQIRETPAGTPVTARCYINVGSAGGFIYAKIVTRNVVGTGSGYYIEVNGEVWVDFFSDLAGTIPVDVSSLGITVNVNHTIDTESGCVPGTSSSTITMAGSGTKIKVYEGLFTRDQSDPGGGCREYENHVFNLIPTSGYIII